MLLLMAPAMSRAADIQAFHKAFGPRTSLKVSSPTVSWEIWPGDGGKVTSAAMQINGDKVPARYDTRRRVLEYTPASPLSPGPYKVACRVVVDEQLVVTKDWSFQVSTEAQPVLSQPDDAQTSAFQLANGLRRTLGLPDLSMDLRLNAAAASHSTYLLANNRSGHYQKEGEAQFSGRTPGERLESFGFLRGSWECVSAGIAGPEQSIRELFDAPYHRLPFMQPGTVEFGSGYTGKRMTLNFGVSDAAGSVVSPADGQTDVPLGWNRSENPNPLRLHTVSGPIGYPIMLAQFGVEKISVKSASLWSGSQPVAALLNTPQNDDHLTNALILIPERPLSPLTSYTVKATILAKGQEISRAWSFRTGAGQQPPTSSQLAAGL
jgi:uncharacterized protein YkwD